MDRYTFDLQINDMTDGTDDYTEVCIVLKQPGSTACFIGAPQVTQECRSADHWNEEIDRAIAELEDLRNLGRQALAKSN